MKSLKSKKSIKKSPDNTPRRNSGRSDEMSFAIHTVEQLVNASESRNSEDNGLDSKIEKMMNCILLPL